MSPSFLVLSLRGLKREIPLDCETPHQRQVVLSVALLFRFSSAESLSRVCSVLGSAPNNPALAESRLRPPSMGFLVKWCHSFLVATTRKNIVGDRKSAVFSVYDSCKVAVSSAPSSGHAYHLHTACTWHMMKNEHVVKTNSVINMSTHT